MPIDYPSSPTVNQIYTYNGKAWVFNGTAWVGAGFVGVNASSANTASYVVQRDASGNFAAGTITAALIGNATTATTATSATTAGTITSQANSATIAAASANTASAIVLRDASGNFSAGTITATLTGNATNVTGIVAIAKGGTGQITANAAVNALLPAQASNSGKYLTSNGTDSSWGAVVGGPAFTVSATAPVSPASGDRWYDTSTGSYLIYLNDGTSSQWVETSNSGMVSNPTGTIIPFAGATAPSGFLLCNGASVSSSDYLALHAVISNTYGGSAYSGAAALNFTLPDYRGRVLIGAGTGSGLTARTLGGTVGTEGHTVSSNNISQFSTGNAGSHSHTFGKPALSYLYPSGAITISMPGGNQHGFSDGDGVNDTSTAADHTHTVGSASPTAISNLQPSIGVNYLIKT